MYFSEKQLINEHQRPFNNVHTYLPSNSLPKSLSEGNNWTNRQRHVTKDISVDLFTEVEQEETQCPSIEDWLNKQWYIHVIQYYN